MKVQHIPHLPSAEKAQSILERIKKEFGPIATARKWNITSLTEMCCCDDGAHHTMNHKTDYNGKTNSKKKGRGVQMSAQVWGYNLSSWYGGRKSSKIHLRLRDPQNHSYLLPYESVARTMAHEMAHCEIGPHSAEFYELMEDIERQHAEYMSKGVILDKQGFPIAGKTYTLGGNSSSSSCFRGGSLVNPYNNFQPVQVSSSTKRQLMRNSAEKRATKSNRELARRAAENRMANGEKKQSQHERISGIYCQPCNLDKQQRKTKRQQTKEKTSKNENNSVHSNDPTVSIIDLSNQDNTPNHKKAKRIIGSDKVSKTSNHDDAGVIDLT